AGACHADAHAHRSAAGIHAHRSAAGVCAFDCDGARARARMRYSRVAALALALVIGGGLGMAVADHGVIERTSAAWTDQTHMSATVAAGTWQVPSTCIAYNKNGAQLAGCKVFPERSR